MKNRVIISVTVLIAFIFTSCEKVIEVDLNSTAKKYVIEATVNDLQGGSSVKITQTKDFNDNNTFPGVSGAIVSVSDNGVPVQLQETIAGVYSNPAVKGISGHHYTLEVKIGNETFKASCTMPVKVNFDTLFVEDEKFFGETRKMPTVKYFDPAGKGNSYRFVLYRNGEAENAIMVINDDYADDRWATWQLITSYDQEDEDKIRKGDTIKVDMFCIDKSVYKYWYSLGAASGGGSGVTPGNPVSNISGGALGYFSAHSLQTRQVVVE